MSLCFTELQNFGLKYFTHQAPFLMSFIRCYHIAKNGATAAIGLPIRTIGAYISRSWQFFNVILPIIANML